MFRKCLKSDLKLSDRLKSTSLESVLLDTLKYSFSGELFLPPVHARACLDKLIGPDHSLCRIKIRGVNITHV